MKRLILLITSLLFIFILYAESDLPCGTIPPPNALEFEREFMAQRESNMERLIGNDTITFSIKIHIVRGDDGIENFPDSVAKIENGIIDTLNLYYAPAKVKFYLCDGFDYINNDTYRIHYQSNDTQLINSYNDPDKINIYYVDQLYCGVSVNGYAYLPTTKNLIIITKRAWNESSVHEMGHYFNLYHTHDSIGGKEFVNGSNCWYAGDWCCDTPADPCLLQYNRYFVDGSCNYTGTFLDPNGDAYNPDVTNIMSYSIKSCRTHLTTEQYARVRAYAESSYTAPFIYSALLDNITINSNTSIRKDVISIKNVGIDNGALQINYCKEVTIENNFEMQHGTTLTIER